MSFRKIFLIISIIGGMALQTACGNSAAEEAVAVEQEGDIAEETEGTETGEPISLRAVSKLEATD